MSSVNLKEYVTVKTAELSVHMTDFWQISVKLAYISRKMASIVLINKTALLTKEDKRR